jgi:hypothetical protein
METIERIKSWLGSEPSTPEDYNRAVAKVGEEI